MSYTLIPGVVTQVQAQQAQGRGGAISGVSNAGLAAGVGILGAAIGGAVEAAFVYGVTRLGAGVDPVKSRKAALWAGGIVFGLSSIMSLIGAGGVAAAEDAAGGAQQSTIDPDWTIT